MAASFTDRLLEGVQRLGLDSDTAKIEALLAYLNLLSKWNRAYNLTAISDRNMMLTHHILDSLAISNYLEGKRFIDVGTGPGLPGIPLAIYNEDKEFVLLDSNGKKTRFLFQALMAVKLSNAKEVQQRAEDYHPAQAFDGIITRAYAPLARMLNSSKHLLRRGGVFYAMKGQYPEREIEAIASNDLLLTTEKIEVPGLNEARYLILIKSALRNSTCRPTR